MYILLERLQATDGEARVELEPERQEEELLIFLKKEVTNWMNLTSLASCKDWKTNARSIRTGLYTACYKETVKGVVIATDGLRKVSIASLA